MTQGGRLFEIETQLAGGRTRSAREIALELGVSVSTVYRDIAVLIGEGRSIESVPGGYRLKVATLPPLHFSGEELKSLAIGARLVGGWGATDQTHAAATALAKIIAVAPFADGRMEMSWGHVFGAGLFAILDETFAALRIAVSEKRKVELLYRDALDEESLRIVRPLSLESGPRSVMIAWCELREDFRNFRIDHVVAATALDERFRPEKGRTLADYRRQRRGDW